MEKCRLVEVRVGRIGDAGEAVNAKEVKLVVGGESLERGNLIGCQCRAQVGIERWR